MHKAMARKASASIRMGIVVVVVVVVIICPSHERDFDASSGNN
jgi:nitrite reductase/ring-hydroxylating ferredoxin subunit